ncbi:GNAT family N-acetyltransferase [Chitinivorax sp. PXF-14]|uniref:GNAT family N-acetyltransferase n=1 Tax=Chitinivorax sp. PXF-14 TaxID=3230488 RepID=UPI003467D582
MKIFRLSKQALREAIPQLNDILIDGVNNGASVGFLAPLDERRATQYWRSIEDSIEQGSRWIWVALVDGKLVGSVQLEFCQRENGLARAEVQRLLVLREYRRKGVATALMNTVEDASLDQRRKLLVLDTESNSAAETFYLELGYQLAGRIPSYANSPDGHLHATAIFYKQLQEEQWL